MGSACRHTNSIRFPNFLAISTNVLSISTNSCLFLLIEVIPLALESYVVIPLILESYVAMFANLEKIAPISHPTFPD